MSEGLDLLMAGVMEAKFSFSGPKMGFACLDSKQAVTDSKSSKSASKVIILDSSVPSLDSKLSKLDSKWKSRLLVRFLDLWEGGEIQF
ncbi:hypothetical protein LRR81_05680 [Metabacillus sp. GX 13764]|uniref:hypothetical protein n=1 Tax=Metabacillus kandeliae TaxID=2900151 RepID=UPI001E41F911|nr:hypothetical protein [Metabacillus kandeliae]MCD7033716.1 hypothetical protein [Metabacillus kandeliae]